VRDGYDRRQRDAALREGARLKARAPTTKWERLANTPLPGIAVLRDGEFVTLGKVADDQVLVQRPSCHGQRR
jgi:hypothetical protein